MPSLLLLLNSGVQESVNAVNVLVVVELRSPGVQSLLTVLVQFLFVSLSLFVAM